MRPFVFTALAVGAAASGIEVGPWEVVPPYHTAPAVAPYCSISTQYCTKTSTLIWRHSTAYSTWVASKEVQKCNSTAVPTGSLVASTGVPLTTGRVVPTGTGASASVPLSTGLSGINSTLPVQSSGTAPVVVPISTGASSGSTISPVANATSGAPFPVGTGASGTGASTSANATSGAPFPVGTGASGTAASGTGVFTSANQTKSVPYPVTGTAASSGFSYQPTGTGIPNFPACWNMCFQKHGVHSPSALCTNYAVNECIWEYCPSSDCTHYVWWQAKYCMNASGSSTAAQGTGVYTSSSARGTGATTARYNTTTAQGTGMSTGSSSMRGTAVSTASSNSTAAQGSGMSTLSRSASGTGASGTGASGTGATGTAGASSSVSTGSSTSAPYPTNTFYPNYPCWNACFQKHGGYSESALCGNHAVSQCIKETCPGNEGSYYNHWLAHYCAGASASSAASGAASTGASASHASTQSSVSASHATTSSSVSGAVGTGASSGVSTQTSGNATYTYTYHHGMSSAASTYGATGAHTTAAPSSEAGQSHGAYTTTVYVTEQGGAVHSECITVPAGYGPHTTTVYVTEQGGAVHTQTVTVSAGHASPTTESSEAGAHSTATHATASSAAHGAYTTTVVITKYGGAVVTETFTIPAAAATSAEGAVETLTHTSYITDVVTITSCAATVTDCPAHSTVVKTTSSPVVVYETTTHAAHASSAEATSSSSAEGAVETLTHTSYSTDIITITSCAPTVTNCPAHSTVLKTTSSPVVVYETTTHAKSSAAEATSATKGAVETLTHTYYSTDIITITSCAPTVTNCPAHSTVLKTTSSPVVVYETTTHGAAASSSVAGPVETLTHTYYSTDVITVTSCGPEVTNCPAHSTVLKTSSTPVVVYETTTHAASASYAHGPVETLTHTSYSTDFVTITSCGPEVTNCPAHSTVVKASSTPVVVYETTTHKAVSPAMTSATEGAHAYYTTTVTVSEEGAVHTSTWTYEANKPTSTIDMTITVTEQHGATNTAEAGYGNNGQSQHGAASSEEGATNTGMYEHSTQMMGESMTMTEYYGPQNTAEGNNGQYGWHGENNGQQGPSSDEVAAHSTNTAPQAMTATEHYGATNTAEGNNGMYGWHGENNGQQGSSSDEVAAHSTNTAANAYNSAPGANAWNSMAAASGWNNAWTTAPAAAAQTSMAAAASYMAQPSAGMPGYNGTSTAPYIPEQTGNSASRIVGGGAAFGAVVVALLL